MLSLQPCVPLPPLALYLLPLLPRLLSPRPHTLLRTPAFVQFLGAFLLSCLAPRFAVLLPPTLHFKPKFHLQMQGCMSPRL